MKPKHLPPRWAYKHGAFYFRPPRDTKHLWDNKSWFRLGKTESEAWRTWMLRNPTQDRTWIASVEQAMDRYIEQVLPSKSPKTQREYLRAISRLRIPFGHMRPQDIRPTHIYGYASQRWKHVSDDKGGLHTAPAPVIAKREIATLSAILQECVHWGVIDDNPARKVRLKGPPPRTRYVEDVELNAFLEECGNDFIRAYVALKMLTGLRQGQLLSLRREWWDGRQLIVPPAKGGRATAYVDNPQGELANAIQALAGVHGPKAVRSTEFIVTTRRGKPYTTDGFRAIWSRAMKKYLDATGDERFTENDLRAKVATDAESLLHAQERLGHTSSKTTLTHYTRKARPVSVHGQGNRESD